jgi:hypothetical protein
MSAIVQNMLDHHARLVPLTVEQYDRMIETGTIPEGAPIELLDGFLVLKDRSERGGNPMSIGGKHTRSVEALLDVFLAIRPLGCYLRSQQSIRLSESEPEPDGAIVLGKSSDYFVHPSAAEVLCVIEVAHSSLEHDLTTKLAIYARAGIPQYLVVNLVDDTVIEHLHPSRANRTYAPGIARRRGETVTIHTPNGPFVVNVADLLA